MPDRPIAAHHRDGKIVLAMESGVEISFPVAGNPRLEGQPPSFLDRIEVSPFGLHWPATTANAPPKRPEPPIPSHPLERR